MGLGALADGRHLLIFDAQHIIFDGMSVMRVRRRLSAYLRRGGAAAAGVELPLLRRARAGLPAIGRLRAG